MQSLFFIFCALYALVVKINAYLEKNIVTSFIGNHRNMTKDWDSISLGQPKEYTKTGVILINNWSITNITIFWRRGVEVTMYEKSSNTRKVGKSDKNVHLWLAPM